MKLYILSVSQFISILDFSLYMSRIIYLIYIGKWTAIESVVIMIEFDMLQYIHRLIRLNLRIYCSISNSTIIAELRILNLIANKPCLQVCQSVYIIVLQSIKNDPAKRATYYYIENAKIKCTKFPHPPFRRLGPPFIHTPLITPVQYWAQNGQNCKQIWRLEQQILYKFVYLFAVAELRVLITSLSVINILPCRDMAYLISSVV